jgi:alpha-N-arabinofuranosidase
MRDAMIAGITLNIFNNHADRVRMANLAQTVNVLQAVILTKEEKLLLTPTYHVMEMYKVHQEALLVPIQLISKDFEWGGQRLQAVSASASLDSLGKMHVSLVNIDPKNIQDHNTFESPNRVMPRPFSQASLSGSRLTVSMPAGSVVVLELIQ